MAGKKGWEYKNITEFTIISEKIEKKKNQSKLAMVKNENFFLK